MSLPVGFIGFGEAASALARGLREEGLEELYAFDVLSRSPEGAGRVGARAESAGVELLDDLESLLGKVEVVFSAVVPRAAVDAAAGAAPHLGAGHLFVDLNSTSPAVKREVARIVEASGASFVEAAVLDAVPTYRHRVPMLVAGPGARAFSERMRPYGMRLQVLDAPVGGPAAAKMCRSVVIKGMEALLLEALLTARAYDVDATVLDSLCESMPGIDWRTHATYYLGRTAMHAERRGHEMEAAAETVRAAGVEPYLAAAAARRMLEVAALDIATRFPDGPPRHYSEVLTAIREALQG
ncbi:MAG: NAD(P)-dependent oxidoreductase [Gemmatimonadetes bacterium]|nr:NAD(P)-dependent oxidoreductase [Gemmatimonadota bacterium]